MLKKIIRYNIILSIISLVILAAVSIYSNRFLIADRIENPNTSYSFRVKDENLPKINPVMNNERIRSKAVSTSTIMSLVAAANQPAMAVGKKLTIDMVVNPGQQTLNVINATIKYSTSTLVLTQVDYSKSAFSIFLKEKLNLNTAVITAFQPTPGIKVKSNVVSFVFKIVGKGETKIEFIGDISALANDGFGTNIFKSAENFTADVE